MGACGEAEGRGGSGSGARVLGRLFCFGGVGGGRGVGFKGGGQGLGDDAGEDEWREADAGVAGGDEFEGDLRTGFGGAEGGGVEGGDVVRCAGREGVQGADGFEVGVRKGVLAGGRGGGGEDEDGVAVGRGDQFQGEGGAGIVPRGRVGAAGLDGDGGQERWCVEAGRNVAKDGFSASKQSAVEDDIGIGRGEFVSSGAVLAAVEAIGCALPAALFYHGEGAVHLVQAAQGLPDAGLGRGDAGDAGGARGGGDAEGEAG